MLKDIIYIFIILLIIFGIFVFIDSFNIDLNQINKNQKLIKTINLQGLKNIEIPSKFF